MTTKALFPSSEPAIELDFANTKALDPRITFTRVMTGASVATYVGADGLIKTAGNNVPRFDHDPTTGGSLGLLVEEARTNYILQSSSITIGGTAPLSGSSWKKEDFGGGVNNTLVSTTNYALAPDGSVTANRLVFTNTSTFGTSYLAKEGVSTLGATTMTGSFYIKSNTGVNQTLQGGIAQYSGISTDPAKTFTATSQWQRIDMTWIIFTIGNIKWLPVGKGLSAGEVVDVLIWGVQLEIGSLPTSYIPTTTATVTRAADVATVSNTNSSIFPTSSFTTINSPFGTVGGGSTVKLVGPTIKRTAIYNGDLPQSQINALTGTDQFWRWRVLGSTFALPDFTTNGNVTVDWGDGVVETLTTGVHTFLDSNVYHTIGFRLNSGTFFRPNISGNATYKDRVIAVGPAPASMRIDANAGFFGCGALRAFDSTINATGGTNFNNAWKGCGSLTSFPLMNTTGVSTFFNTWQSCGNLTSFPLIDTAAGTVFEGAWQFCSGLTSFPPINTGAATNLYGAWAGCSGLTSFPLISLGTVTSLSNTWNSCSSLTSFPLINTSAVTNFSSAWFLCSGLTSFPLINTGAGTNFQSTWANCPGLTNFPLINTSAGTNFTGAWNNCRGLSSFPSISFTAATTFAGAWFDCISLATFPANMFDTTGNLVSGAFGSAFQNCPLTAASIENILTSLVTNGRSNIQLLLGGANTSTWSTAANNAYITLVSRGWTITQNGTAPT